MDQTTKLTVFNEIKSDKKFLLAALILCLCNIVIYKTVFFNSTNASHKFTRQFPNKISNWTSEDVNFDEAVISSLDPDKTVYKTYYKNETPPITLFMACYDTLEKADLSHSPIVCFTGQGWEVTNVTKKDVKVDISGKQTIEVNQLIQKKSDVSMITLFWYQSHNRAFSNRGIQKVYLFAYKLLGNPDRNAFVRLTLSVPKTISLEKASDYLDAFVEKLYPELLRYF